VEQAAAELASLIHSSMWACWLLPELDVGGVVLQVGDEEAVLPDLVDGALEGHPELQRWDGPPAPRPAAAHLDHVAAAAPDEDPERPPRPSRGRVAGLGGLCPGHLPSWSPRLFRDRIAGPPHRPVAGHRDGEAAPAMPAALHQVEAEVVAVAPDPELTMPTRQPPEGLVQEPGGLA
jgi:hypothetical protein